MIMNKPYLSESVATFYLGAEKDISKGSRSIFSWILMLLLIGVIFGGLESILEVQAAKDNKPPTVKITAPLTGVTLSAGTIIVKGTSSDNRGGSGVNSVQVHLNGGTYINAVPKNSGDWSSWTVSINMFSVGSQKIVAKATDYAGNTKLHQIIVSTIDTTPPQLIAPLDVTVESSGPATIVILGSPTVIDQVDPNPSISNDAPSGFPLGTTVVKWTAVDFSGNLASATQNVIVGPTLFDNFDDQPAYTLPKTVASPNGKWISYSTGYGENGVADEILYLHPHSVPFTDDDGSIHYSVGPAVRTTEPFQDYRLEIDMRYDQTTRTDTAPKRWEEAVWLLFDHQLDTTHFRYFHVDREGVGVGYYDGGVNPTNQQIINEARNGIQVARIDGVYSTDPAIKALTSYPPHVTQGQWTHIILDVLNDPSGGRRIIVTVDEVPVYDFIHATSFSGGYIMLYCEDAWISVDNVRITKM